jgi:hypothetical protein
MQMKLLCGFVAIVFSDIYLIKIIYEGGGIKYPDTLSRSEKLAHNYYDLKI